MRSTSQLRQVWAPPCSRRPPLSYTMWTGVRVNVDGRIGEALRALDQIMRAWNYRPKEGQSWGYNCRRITGGTGYSLHAYGIAIDINSLANPYGPRLITDMPPAMVAAIKAIKTKGGHRVWGWGGDYSRNKDAMHFEVVASPGELATGIDWRSVAGTVTTQTVTKPPPPPPPLEDDEMHISLAPGEEDVFWIEPTTPGGSILGVKRVIVVLTTHGHHKVPARVWLQSENGPGDIELTGARPWARHLANRPGTWLYVKNNGSAHVGGRIIEVR